MAQVTIELKTEKVNRIQYVIDEKENTRFEFKWFGQYSHGVWYRYYQGVRVWVTVECAGYSIAILETNGDEPNVELKFVGYDELEDTDTVDKLGHLDPFGCLSQDNLDVVIEFLRDTKKNAFATRNSFFYHDGDHTIVKVWQPRLDELLQELKEVNDYAKAHNVFQRWDLKNKQQ
jgi:hypothetical protein